MQPTFFLDVVRPTYQ